MAEDNTPTNVVDDLTPNQLADNFFNSLNRNTTGNVELYVKHAGGNVPANEIKFSHTMGGANHIPGFYTEPIGNKTLNQIRGPGNYGDAVDNFYKVQVNTDNLLINIQEGEFRGRDIFYPKSNVGGSAPLGDQIEKIDWDIFAQETGVSFDDLVESSKNSTPSFRYDDTGKRVYDGGSETFTKVLAREVGDTELAFTALRKAGIEGFVSGPTNAQYEVVLLDPNDDLGIGKKINIEDTTVEQFKTSQATANPIDEIIIDTPTNVVDDIKLTGTTGGNTNVKGSNIAYVDVEELYPYVQYDRRTDTRGMPDDYIDNIKKTIYEEGFMYDNANEGVNVFAVFFDDTGNVQINEGNHRLRALFEVAQETGQKIYVPVNPFITKITAGNKVQNVSTLDAHNSIEQLIRDLTTGKNQNTEYAIETKLGEPGRGVSGLESYTYPGGAGGTSASQNDIKKFFNSIGINAITYDELPDDSIYKTGVNTFKDTPTNVVDDFIIGKDWTDLDVKLSVSDDGYVQLWRGTDDPNRLVISDFTKTGGGGRSGLGEQNYFSPTPEYANEYSGYGRRLYQFETKIKPNEILNIDIYYLKQTHPELVPLFYDVEAPGGPIRRKGNIQSNIGKLRELGYKAVGTAATGNQRVGQVQFEIIPLIENLDDTYGIKPIAVGQGGLASGKPITWIPLEDTPDRPFGPGAAHIDDIAFSTESFIDNLPLEKSVKDLFLNAADTRLKRLAGQVASPGGILDAVDIWEIGVLALVAGAIAYNEIDEIPKIGKNAILRTYNLSQGRPIDAPVRIMGLHTFEISEYDIDFEYAMETLEKGEKVMPTDIIIKELAEHSLEEGKPAVLPGTGVTATTGIDEEFAPYKESIIKEREETAKIKEDEVKQKLLESKGVQEEKMFKKAKPKKSSGAGSRVRIL